MSETLDHHSCSGIHSSDSQESGHSLMPSKFHDYMTTFWTVQVLCIGKHANQQSDLQTHTHTVKRPPCYAVNVWVFTTCSTLPPTVQMSRHHDNSAAKYLSHVWSHQHQTSHSVKENFFGSVENEQRLFTFCITMNIIKPRPRTRRAL